MSPRKVQRPRLKGNLVSVDEVARCNFSLTFLTRRCDVKKTTEPGSRARRKNHNCLVPALFERKKLEKVKQDAVAQQRCGKEARTMCNERISLYGQQKWKRSRPLS